MACYPARTPVRRGADPAWPPFEFRDKQGVYAGMCQDYTNIIVERRTGTGPPT